MNKDYYYIAGLTRTLAWTDASNYIDDELVVDLNVIRQDIYARIISRVRSNPFWDEAYVNLYSGVSEYNFPWADDDKPIEEQVYSGFSRILKVFVKKNENYIELPYREITDVSDDWDKEYPSYTIADNSIIIFPRPSADIEGGLKVHGINVMRDIEVGAIEEKVFANKIPRNRIETIAMGAAMWYCRYRKRDFDEAQRLEIEYEKMINILVSEMNSRSVRIYDNEPAPVRTDLQ